MTLTVNGQAAEPGCYVEGHWGQYGLDHLADQLEGFGLEIPKGIDPRRYRRIADWTDERSPAPLDGPLANVYLACMENDRELEDFANEATEGGYWEWYDGECFLRSYVCPECGRDATLPVDGPASDNWRDGMAEVPACDYCCDADDPGVFA